MSDLKARLGVTKPVEPPLALAQANATAVEVGQAVRFRADGSRDPQGLSLSYAWDFGDGATGTGAIVDHVYAEAGAFEARVVVTNERGGSDDAVVSVEVAAPNTPPVALLRVSDADGKAVERTTRRAILTFDASGSTDAEGALAVDWDLGDGRTSHQETVEHAYAEPGLYTVRLLVRDAAGATAERTLLLPVDATYTGSGGFGVGDADVQTLAFPVHAHAKRVDVTLTFDGAAGANDLRLRLVDPGARTVASDDTATQAGASGTQTRRVALAEATLVDEVKGEWSVEVRRVANAPTGVAWTLVVDTQY